jgi:hypothetical protein
MELEAWALSIADSRAGHPEGDSRIEFKTFVLRSYTRGERFSPFPPGMHPYHGKGPALYYWKHCFGCGSSVIFMLIRSTLIASVT